MKQRPKWSSADYAAAMVRYVQAHAKHPEAKRDGGIQSEAFYRAGDNPSSLRVWPSGTWADARHPGSGGNAISFARIVAGQELTAFMGQWFGGVSLEAKPQKPRLMLPAHELTSFARMTSPVAESPTCLSWLERRGMSTLSAELDTLRLARAIPADAPVPWWAKTKHFPWTARHHLVVGLYDGVGARRSFHARRVVDDGIDDIKVGSPAGYTTAGLVMANEAARAMLQRKHAPSSLWINEGLPAFLGLAASPRLPAGAAVIGHLSGGWCEAHAATVPDGTRVVIYTDTDKAGNDYAAHIASTFTGRAVELVRGTREK